MSMFSGTGTVLNHSLDRACKMPQPESETAAQEAAHRTFEEQSSEFYWLAYLLTGDSEQAVQAFTSALEFGDAPTPVFREFMISWSRKLVIASALARVASKLRASALRFEHAEFADMARHASLSSSAGLSSQDLTKPELHRALLAIDIFPRCALLLTIFEKLSVKDAALLLNADERLVRRAQASALIDLTRNLALVEVGAAHRGELSVGVGCRI
jgi:hypothetical protein